MVLSNKKLKQKLRAARAELKATLGVTNKPSDKNSENSGDFASKNSDSMGIVVNPESRGLKLSKREKRRQNAQENPDFVKVKKISSGAERKKEENGLQSDAVEVKKKKKRKRDESTASENGEEKKAQPPKKKKKKAKKKKKSKSTVGNLQIKEEGKEHDVSGPSEEQPVAKADESINRKEDVEVSDKVYVGGIPYYSTEDDIRSYFEHCGTITEVDCMTFPDTGKFRGIAIISFKTEAAAKRALALDGSDMGGFFLKIQPFKSSKANKSSNFFPTVLEGYNRIYLGNLSWDVTEDDVKNLFSDCAISSIRFGEDKETGEFKGYAHVDFADSISLKKALHLDQNIVCGRPVKISCAVPKKGAASKLNSMPKDNKVSSVNVSAVSAVSEDQLNSTQVDSVKVNAVSEDMVDSSVTDPVSSKIRRRTCYECGEKGHLSSACPKILAAHSTNPGTKLNSMPLDNKARSVEVSAFSEDQLYSTQVDSVKFNAVSEDKVDSSVTDPVSSKIRRRTCYECGEKGHLSSACPKILTAHSTNPGAKLNSTPKDHRSVEVSAVKNQLYRTQVDSFKVYDVSEDKVDSSVTNQVSSKIRRRTCYECGEKGHLSSACPKILAADSTNRGAKLNSMPNDMKASSVEVSAVREHQLNSSQVDSVKVNAVSENKFDSSVTTPVSSKIRRRTCYECGEKGHLSSACPKMLAVGSTNPGAT